MKDKDVCRCGGCGAWKVRTRLCFICGIILQAECVESTAKRLADEIARREGHTIARRQRELLEAVA